MTSEVSQRSGAVSSVPNPHEFSCTTSAGKTNRSKTWMRPYWGIHIVFLFHGAVLKYIWIADNLYLVNSIFKLGTFQIGVWVAWWTRAGVTAGTADRWVGGRRTDALAPSYLVNLIQVARFRYFMVPMSTHALHCPSLSLWHPESGLHSTATPSLNSDPDTLF